MTDSYTGFPLTGANTTALRPAPKTPAAAETTWAQDRVDGVQSGTDWGQTEINRLKANWISFVTGLGGSLADGDDQLKNAVIAYVAAQIAALADVVDGAPALLDTLNELSAAIGDDPSFAATMTTALAGKLALAGGTMTGDLSISRGASNTWIVLDGNAATYRGILVKTAGVLRWAVYPGYADAESGSNAGTSFRLLAYSDAGSYVGTALAIKRSNLNMAVGHITPDRMLHPEVDDAVNNGVTQVLRVTHTTSGTPAANIGAGIEFEVETADNNNEVGATIEAVAAGVSAAAENFDLVIKTMVAGAAASEALRVGSAAIKASRQVYFPEATLTDAANINWAVGAAQTAKVTLGGNRTFNAPTGMIAGALYVLRVIQDGTGSRTLTWNAVFKFGATPVLQTAAGAVDVFLFESDGTNLYGKHLNEVVDSSPFSASFTSSEQTVTFGGSLTLAHGLGATPTLVQLQLKCITAEGDYSIGDIYELGAGATSGTDKSTAVWCDATNVNIRFAGAAPNISRKSFGSDFAITAAKWKLIVKAWK